MGILWGYNGILLYHQLDILLGLTFALYQVQAPQWEPKRVLLEPAPLESDGIYTYTHTWIFERAHIIVRLQDFFP